MPDRDQHVDRLLREAMAAPVRAESADCLDVETIAAWSDGSLRTDERARAETHAATCTRCQSMLAAMIRMEPVVTVASPSPFRKWLVMLGPAVGAAAAVALWFAVDRPTPIRGPAEMAAQTEERATSVPQQEKKERELSAAPSSQAVPAESPKESVDARSARRATEADKIVADADERKRDAASPAKPLDRFADAKAKSISGAAGRLARAEGSDTARNVGSLPPAAPSAPPPPVPEPLRQDRAQTQQAQTVNEGVNQRANQQLNQAPPSPMQTQQNAAQTNQPAAGERRVTESPAPAPPPATITTTASQPARDTAAGAGRGQAAGGVAGAQGYFGKVAGPPLSTVNVPTSNPATRYRALLGRNIQRSTDGGTTWATVRVVAPPAAIVAGVSPAPAVCWLAATGGLVLSTADGVTWREAKLPEAGEIRSIAAVDANTATVILTDGRMLTTTNGGTSWAPPR